MVNPFNPHTSENYDVKAAQDQVEEFTRPLVDNPTLKGVYLDSIQLEAGATVNVIEHKLNRKIRGWYIVRAYDVGLLTPAAPSIVTDNMLVLYSINYLLNPMPATYAWRAFYWDGQRIVGSSFSHTPGATTITINDPGYYHAASTLGWYRAAPAGGAGGFGGQLSLQRNGGAWGVLNETYGLTYGAGDYGSQIGITGFYLAPGDVPALFRVNYTSRVNLKNHECYPAGCNLVLHTVGKVSSSGGGSFVPIIREETEDNDDPTKYLQLLTDVDCVVDLWIF